MGGASVRVLLGVSTLLLFAPSIPAVFVNIVPNRLQFFPSESFSVNCGGVLDLSRWTLKRTKTFGGIQQCRTGQEDFGRFDGVSCTVSAITWLEDSGEYWCEDDNGRSSDKLRIYVNEYLILEIPAYPLNVGDSITLRCRSRYSGTDGIEIHKYIGDSWSSTRLPSEVTFKPVQVSDGGKYECSGFYQDMWLSSGRSRLTVRAPTTPPPTTPPPTTPTLTTLLSTTSLPTTSPPTTSPPTTSLPTASPPTTSPPTTSPPTTPSPPPISLSPPPPSFPLLRLLIHLVVVCPYCISTILMVSIFCNLKKGSRAAVAMEMTNVNEEPDYDDVIIEDNS